MISEPEAVKKIKDSEYDYIEMCCTKVVPAEFTTYDKTIVNEGSLTVQGLVDHLAAKFNVVCQIITCDAGKEEAVLYNSELPSNPHADRVGMPLEKVMSDKCNITIPDYAKWVKIDTSGIIKDSEDGYRMPPIKYVFK